MLIAHPEIRGENGIFHQRPVEAQVKACLIEASSLRPQANW